VKTNQNTIQLIHSLWQHIELKQRRKILFLIPIIIFTSLAEVISIGSVLPFLALLTSPDKFFNHPFVKSIIQRFGFINPEQLLLPLTIIFILFIVIAGVMRLLLLWANTSFSYSIGADLSMNIYNRTLHQPYEIHCARNSSEIISSISNKINVVIGIITMFFTLISSTVILIMIMTTLLFIQPVIALSVFCGFGFIYGVIILLTRKQLSINSDRISFESNYVIKSLQEGLGGIRDVLIDGSQSIYCQIYRNADSSLRRAQASNMFIVNSPRYLIEALGMVFIVAIAYLLAQQSDGVFKAIPILGALVLGAQRLLPLLQQAYGALTSILGSKSSFQDILELLNQPLPKDIDDQHTPLLFNNSIKLKQIRFRYNLQTPYVLKDINLNIIKGSRIGFIGPTGSGKSTLLDIIMGLLQSADGNLEVDERPITSINNKAWQAHIAHVPQAIFLADSSIEENIAFGVPKNQIDHQRVLQVARQAQIAKTIEGWPKQYETFVGERGIRLSGGQRQRIGIARALYKKADVIIFDEATSSLDNETEQAVIKAIDNLSKDLTLLIIAHRLSTLRNCTQIVELYNGGIKRISNYQDMIKNQ